MLLLLLKRTRVGGVVLDSARQILRKTRRRLTEGIPSCPFPHGILEDGGGRERTEERRERDASCVTNGRAPPPCTLSHRKRKKREINRGRHVAAAALMPFLLPSGMDFFIVFEQRMYSIQTEEEEEEARVPFDSPGERGGGLPTPQSPYYAMKGQELKGVRAEIHRLKMH